MADGSSLSLYLSHNEDVDRKILSSFVREIQTTSDFVNAFKIRMWH